jgi:AdoMet-dependent heme synthase
MFVSNTGEILPAGFLPIRCGRVCEYNTICGGSRSRAYGVTGDPLESEPDCVHVPEKLRALQPV